MWSTTESFTMTDIRIRDRIENALRGIDDLTHWDE